MCKAICSMLPRLSLPKHPTHDAVFDKYIKLFDARPNAIHTFGICIKQFITASNTEFLYILETPSYFVLSPWCIKPSNIVLDLVHQKKDHTDTSVYQQLFMEIWDGYRDYIHVYTDDSRDGNSVACAKPPKSVLNLIQNKKDCTDASMYQQLFIESWDGYCD